ncbi:MAG: host attachment protein [Akkermansiaceae bacterium]
MENNKHIDQTLLILTDLGKVRVLTFTTPGDDPRERAHLKELTEKELGSPEGAETSDTPGKFNRGYNAGEGEAMSHAETKLNVEIEKRSINQVAAEICDKVAFYGSSSFILAAPQEHLNRLMSEMPVDCRDKISESHGLDLTNEKLADLEKRFLK